MAERSNYSPREQLVAMRNRLRHTIGRLRIAAEQQPAQNPFNPGEYPVNIAAFYTVYTEARNRLLEEAWRRDIDLARNVGGTATLSMHALTEAIYDRQSHGLRYLSGFAYPEVHAQRQQQKNFVDVSDVTLNIETRDTALEFTQAWIVHANRQQPDEFADRIMWDSFKHMGCSLTVDCLPAGISFDDLGIQQTAELVNEQPATVFTYLEIDPTMYPESPIVEDVTRAFAGRVAAWQ